MEEDRRDTLSDASGEDEESTEEPVLVALFQDSKDNITYKSCHWPLRTELREWETVYPTSCTTFQV